MPLAALSPKIPGGDQHDQGKLSRENTEPFHRRFSFPFVGAGSIMSAPRSLSRDLFQRRQHACRCFESP